MTDEEKLAPERSTPLYKEELQHLGDLEKLLKAELARAEEKVAHLEEQYQETKKDRQENYYEMDSREHLQMGRILADLDRTISEADRLRARVAKLSDSPYFARIDFREEGNGPAVPYYIGSFGFEQDHEILIFDWRAPVSSMFYDCETGPASYLAPDGEIKGEMTLKRQYKIKNGELIYALDNSQTVSDDVLQEELSRSSDEKMKTIISTIQKEQNRIIRNEKPRTMIIQGVAGSGKTSIALHRIAFLLYRFAGKLKAEDVLIISPNRAFSDYISGVIPELGEEPIRESSFYEIAIDNLDNVLDFEDELSPLDTEDRGWKKRSLFKSTPDFLEALKEYVRVLPERIFQPKDFVYDRIRVEKEWILEQFLFYKNDPLLKRIPVIAAEVLEEFRLRAGLWADLPKQSAVERSLRSMLTIKSASALYHDFYKFIGRPDMLNMKKKRIEWPDVFPFLYLWNAYKGLDRHLYIKHLVVDEMQDYTPVQYEVLNIMYPCQKTILGDFGQILNPTHMAGLEDLLNRFPDADFVEMNKSFRSTEEIMEYAKKISPQPKLEPLDRHGEEPRFLHFETAGEEVACAVSEAREFLKKGNGSMGILLKNNALAASFYEALAPELPEAYLLTPQSKNFRAGVIVTSLQMAKGLEFDEVMAAGVNEENYHEEYDRHLLYVACTRAMHKLILTGTGKPCGYLP